MSNKEKLLELLARTKAADLPLKESATNLVFGKGNPEAEILFIGEAPGKNEDLKGIPFVGAAGKELDKLLNGIGLTIDDVYIANILKYRPPNNRDPNEDEIKAHTPYLVEQIKTIKPKVICTLGNFSTKFVLAGFKVDGMKNIPGITGLHGKPRHMTVSDFSFTVIPLYHPAAMLYKRALAETMEKDFKIVKKHIGGTNKKRTLLDY
ncbi:uracil-DNA glycosylase [Candidatus Woesearchaeota archaeon]|nr:uracil-DNA glycosylase [Candidatus Woesearchaeota archaeon]